MTAFRLLAGTVRLELTKCLSQIQVPYRLATPQYFKQVIIFFLFNCYVINFLGALIIWYSIIFNLSSKNNYIFL